MKALIGCAFVVAGMALGVYVGIWWAFIGGIVDIIQEIKAPTISELNLATGLAKTLFAGPIGCLAGVLPVAVGMTILEDS